MTVKKKRTKQKLLNLSFNDIGITPDVISKTNFTTDEINYLKSVIGKYVTDGVPEHVKEKLMAILSITDPCLLDPMISALSLANIVREKAAASPKQQSGKKAYIVKWAEKALKMLSASSITPEAKKFILDPKRFVKLDSPGSVSLMLNGKLSGYNDTNIAASAFDVAIENSEFRDQIPYIEVQDFGKYDDGVDYGSTTHREYHSHYGFYPNGLPIVTHSALHMHKNLVVRPLCSEHALQIESLSAPFEAHNSRISRFCVCADKDVYRGVLEEAAFVGEEYRTNYRAVQDHVTKTLGNGYAKLKEIEGQARKTGPRVRQSDPAFWNQIVELYTAREMTEKGKRMLKLGTESFFKRFEEKVGKLEMVPLIIGVTSSKQLSDLIKLIHCEDKENDAVRVMAKKLWDDIITTSLGEECVYSHIKKTTSKGAPYFTANVSDLEWLHIIHGWYVQLENPSKVLNTTPFQLVERVQNSTPDMDNPTQISKVRHRVAQGVPVDKAWHMAITIPLANAMRSMPEFCSMLGHEEVGVTLEAELANLFEEGRKFTLCSTDISGYDSGLSGVMSEDCVWEALANLFTKKEGDAEYFSAIFKNWKNFYLYAPLCVPGGYLTGKHGLQSGAAGTSSLGTLWNMCCNEGMAIEANYTVLASHFQGDDAFVAIDGVDVSLEEICSLLKEFGHIAAADPVKQAFMRSTDPEPYAYFVGKYFFFSGESAYKPVYCISDCVARFVWPEDSSKSLEAEMKLRDWTDATFNDYYITYSASYKSKKKVNNPSLDYAVKLAQSISNCEHHPLFQEFVDDVVASAPGLFFPLVHENLGEARDFYDVVAEGGTLVGQTKEQFEEGFTSQPGIQAILRALEKTKWAFSDYKGEINLCKLADPIANYKKVRGELNAGGGDYAENKKIIIHKLGFLSPKIVAQLRDMNESFAPKKKAEAKEMPIVNGGRFADLF